MKLNDSAFFDAVGSLGIVNVVAGRVVFLPGAGGSAGFWREVGERLPAQRERVYLGWPGLGDEPHDPAVRGFDDLVELVEGQLDAEADLVAQSMGGIVAVRVALRRPEAVRRLVLVATSGGIDVAGLGGANWRAEYQRSYPRAAAWITTEQPDHASDIPRITAPTLLIWGDADPISPVAVGERLLALLPNARLEVLAGATHDLAIERADEVASLISRFLEENLPLTARTA